MLIRNFKILATTVFFIILSISTVQSRKLKCDGQNQDVQCLLYQYYENLDDQLGCQLCAVALQHDRSQYKKKTHQFCNNPQGLLRQCGFTSFAYLLTQERFQQAFDKQYEIFYKEPFDHDSKVSAILKKQHIREALISWLQKNQQNDQQEILLGKAIANLYLDDMIQSLKQLQKYLQKVNNQLDRRTVKLKCRVLERQGQFNEAYNVISSYIKNIQKDQTKYQTMLEPYLYHINGNLLMHHLKFDQAILQFRKASNMFKAAEQDIKFIRGFRLSNYNIGLCYQKLSKYEEAIKVYMQLIKFVQKNAQILNALGNSFIQWAQQSQKFDEQKLRKGIFYLTQSIAMNQNYYIAYYNLGYGFLKLNALQKAIQNFNKSLSIKITRQAQYGLLAAYLVAQKIELAQNLIKTMKIDSQSIDDLLSVYYENSDINKIHKFYKSVISQFENLIKSANGHYWKAMIQFQLQKYGLAIDHFLQAYDKGYSQPHLLFNLAYSYELIGETKSAIQYYQKAYKKDPRPETIQKINQNKKIITNKLQQKLSDHQL